MKNLYINMDKLVMSIIYDEIKRGETGSIAQAAVLRFRCEVNRMLAFPETAPQIVSEIADEVVPVAHTADFIAGECRTGYPDG